MRRSIPIEACQAALFCAMAPAGAALAALSAGLPGFAAACLMAAVFAGGWALSRQGGPVLSAVVILLFGVHVMQNFLFGPVGLAAAQATGYVTGILWAAAVSLTDMLYDLRILNLRRLHKLY